MSSNDLAQIVARLEDLGFGDPAAVADTVASARVSNAALRPYARYRPDRYTRNLVYRSEQFDLIVLCWGARHATPIHDHAGQHGWVRVLRGALHEDAFTLGERGLRPAGHALAEAGPTVVAVDPLRAIHRLGNPSDEAALSLHVYARPHDACLVYCGAEGRPERRELSFDHVELVSATM